MVVADSRINQILKTMTMHGSIRNKQMLLLNFRPKIKIDLTKKIHYFNSLSNMAVIYIILCLRVTCLLHKQLNKLRDHLTLVSHMQFIQIIEDIPMHLLLTIPTPDILINRVKKETLPNSIHLKKMKNKKMKKIIKNMSKNHKKLKKGKSLWTWPHQTLCSTTVPSELILYLENQFLLPSTGHNQTLNKK